MTIAVYVLTGICFLLIFMAYCCLIIASDADERAEAMYKKWKERKQYDAGHGTHGDDGIS